MSEYTSDNRIYSLKTPLGADVLLVGSLVGQEAISRPFSFSLQLSSSNPNINYDDLVSQAVTLSIELPGDAGSRYVTGHVARFAQTTQKTDANTYEMEIVAWLWFLGHTSDCRIFQEKAAPDIITQIFDEAGYSGQYELKLEGAHEPREYCVQYRETDLNFVSRLMEEEGIFYYFQHTDGDHKLVLADSPGGATAIEPSGDVEYLLANEEEENRAAVTAFSCNQAVTSTAITLQSFDFKKPATNLEVCKENLPDHEVYDYPGNYTERGAGESFAQFRLEEQTVMKKVFNGEATDRRLVSGYTFQLAKHMRDDFNSNYLLIGVNHSGSQDDVSASYVCKFRVIPAETPFRPPRITPRPLVSGCQTAMVTGPSGEEIWLDKYGRIKVQFPWDREGKNDENSSCWIRVAQSWAGKNWGAISNPRIGQEVIIQFLEGDPDRPIVVGSVYNDNNMPPYELPANGTINALKSRSSKKGEPDNFNEIKFEDKKGEELIYIQAEKTFNMEVKDDASMSTGSTRSANVGTDDIITVEGNRTLSVKKDCSDSIDGNFTTTVGGDESHTVSKSQTTSISDDQTIDVGKGQSLKVEKDQIITIGASQTQSVKTDQTLQVDGDQSATIKGDQSFSVKGNIVGKSDDNIQFQAKSAFEIKGDEIVIKGGKSITLKCGSSKIVLDSGGITLKGSKINEN